MRKRQKGGAEMSLEREYNALVERYERQRALPGIEEGAVFEMEHHWKVRVLRGVHGSSEFEWRVFVGAGTVNDRMATVPYLPEGDPRGWVMGPDYPGLARMQRFYGVSRPPVIDRLLTEREDLPHLLVTTPGEDGETGRGGDLETTISGDFVRVPDNHLRPPAFRSRRDWELELWQAHVFVTAESRRYSAVETRLGFPVPTRNHRYRVAVAPRMPQVPLGQPANFHELARLYLLRDARKPGRGDRLLVQQRCFWSLWTARQTPGLDIDVTGNGTVVDAIVQSAFRFLAAALSRGVPVPFWTAV